MPHSASRAPVIHHHHRYWLLASLTLMLLLLCVCLSSYAVKVEQKTGLHWLFHLRGPITPPSDIRIIGINSAAGENMNLSRQTSSWSRDIYAALIDRLTQAQVRLIVMDIAFKDARREEEDAALENALRNNGKVLLFKYLRRHQINLGKGLADIEEEIAPLQRFTQHALASGSFVLPKYPAEVTHAYLFTELTKGKEATQPLLAFLALQPEAVRQSLWDKLRPEQQAPEKLSEWARLLGEIWPVSTVPTLSTEEKDLLVRLLHLPNPMPINFYGPAETFSTVPIDRALQMTKEEMRQQFHNKVVYVGYSDSRQTEQMDAYRTVFSDRRGVDISGVEISATVLANLLQNNYLKPPNHYWMLGLALVFAAIAILAHQFSAPVCLIIQFLSAGAYLAISYRLFLNYFVWLPIVIPFIALLLSNSIMWTWHYLQQKKREQEIRYMLTQYLPTEAAHKLSRDFSRLEQQRQLVQGVCLLTDVQGYTRLAETISPIELHALMNRYYAVLIQTVEEHGGFIGNLVGDGMLALWTGSEIDDNMCKSALLAVHDIQKRLEQEPDLTEKLPTCFGLHGGQFSLGNLGHFGHFEYSPVGDMINTASRIEHLNRQLKTRILCSAPVANHLNDVKLRFLGNFSLRNKAVPVALYTYADTPTDLDVRFKQAYELYENRHFGLALAQFAQIADAYADGPSLYFANACREELSARN